MALWTSFFLVAWKRRASVLAYRWGVLGFEDEETTRADFQGDDAISTDRVKRYPVWKRLCKYGVTWSLVWLCIGCTITFMYLIFRQK